MTANEIKCEVGNKLDDLYRITDHYVPLSAQGKFSEYDNAKEAILEIADEYIRIYEELDEVEEDKTEAEEKLQNTQEDIEDIMKDLENIDMQDPIDDIDRKIQEIYKGLDKIRSGERLYEPVAKKKKNGRIQK